MRVDAHHHLWDLTARSHDWLDAAGMEPIRRSFGVDELTPLASAASIEATVLVQVLASTEETADFLRLAAGSPLVAGVVGWVDLTSGSVADDLAQLEEGPGGDRLVAVRHLVEYEPDPWWLARPEVKRGLRAVEAAGLAYDLLTLPAQLPAAIEAVRSVPSLRFVLDHLSKPRIASGGMEPWRGYVEELAAEENVVAKLSGLVTEAAPSAWTVDDLQPYVEVALGAFGPERLMFGSDWPVCLLAADYRTVVGTVEEMAAGLSAAEAAQVFGGTAERVYALARPAAAREPPR